MFAKLANAPIHQRSGGIFILHEKFPQKYLQNSKICCNFASLFREHRLVMLSNAQCPYYQARNTEAALCEAFPVDQIIIQGLRALQMHFRGKGIDCYIPTLNIMNAAHRIAAYMFVSEHTIGQSELDAMAYEQARYDMQRALIILLVLAAILKRTEGTRARTFRSVILDNRGEEFNEGVALFEQFLSHTELHFQEEDFLIDVAEMALTIQQQNRQLQQLQKHITAMENQQNNQYIQYNAPVYNGCTFNNTTSNNNYTQPTTAETHKQPQTAAEAGFVP